MTVNLAVGVAGPAGGVSCIIIGYVGCLPQALGSERVVTAFTTGYWSAHGAVYGARRLFSER